VEEGHRSAVRPRSHIVAGRSARFAEGHERGESESKMSEALGKVAELRHVGFFPRCEVEREGKSAGDPIDNFVIADGLHMNDGVTLTRPVLGRMT